MSAWRPVALTAPLIEAFAGAFLSPLFDNPAPTPQFHRECWELYCTPAPLIAVAAPRGHAKSTALTHVFGLAVALFRVQDYIVIVSATEDLAIGHLGDIAKELRDNEDIAAEFGIKGLSTDAKTDVIVDFEDGHQCRFIARGSGQKIRGLKWKGKRPGLILCDDLEEDEQVENRDRREKFRKWVLRALLPCRRRGGVVRVHGTILHEDAFLARVMRQPESWVTRLYRAHTAFDDFSNILWPDAFSERLLRQKRQEYIDDGDAPGYSQEYLNDPFDNTQAFLRKSDFLGMDQADREAWKRNAVGCDFAVSKKDKANRTSFTVGGQDARHLISVFDQHVGRWATDEWIDLLFDIQRRWEPEIFFVEDGVIWKSVSPTIYKEMLRRNEWINFQPIMPVADKAVRGRPLQKVHRAGGMRFDKEADWYPAYEAELLRFTGYSDALQDDQFDSTAILVKGLIALADVEDEDSIPDEDLEFEAADPRRGAGRSAVTGY